jgi:hypothetical protein
MVEIKCPFCDENTTRVNVNKHLIVIEEQGD